MLRVLYQVLEGGFPGNEPCVSMSGVTRVTSCPPFFLFFFLWLSLAISRFFLFLIRLL